MKRVDSSVTVIILLLAVFRDTLGCPESATCKCEYRSRSVVCTRTTNLQYKLPRGIPANTDSLTVTLTTLKKVGPTAFTSTRALTKLDLSSNKIDTLSETSLQNLRELRVLNLENNRIKLIPEDAFDESSKLRVLHLSGNRILVLVPLNFKGLTRLEELYLLRNPTMCIAQDAFAGLPNLRRLEMSEMNATFDSDLLTSLTELRTLVLRGFRRVRTVPDDFFTKNLKLEKLYLENIQLSKGISNGVLVPLKNLNTLSLRGCSLSCVPDDALKPVKSSLTVLDLSHNPLKKISASDFKGMTQLKTLSLRKTGLTLIPANALALPALTSLDISGNMLETLTNTTFGTGPLVLRNLTMGNNPWICDCRLKWLVKQGFHHSPDIPVVCAEPAGMQSFDIRYLNWALKPGDYFQCQKPEIYKFGINVEGETTLNVKSNDIVSFEAMCVANGYPRPEVKWIIHRSPGPVNSRKRRDVKKTKQDRTLTKLLNSVFGSHQKRSADVLDENTFCTVCNVPSKHRTEELWVSEDGTLRVRDLMGDAAFGIYTCSATNYLGSSKASIVVADDSTVVSDAMPPPTPHSMMGFNNKKWDSGRGNFVTDGANEPEYSEQYQYDGKLSWEVDAQYANRQARDYDSTFDRPRLMKPSSTFKGTYSTIPVRAKVRHDRDAYTNDKSAKDHSQGYCRRVDCQLQNSGASDPTEHFQQDSNAAQSKMIASSDMIDSLTREASCCGGARASQASKLLFVFSTTVSALFAYVRF